MLVLALMGLLVALPASAAPSGAVNGTIVLSNGTSGTGVASKGEFYSDQTLCGDGTTTCNVAKVTVTDADLSVTSTGTARIVTTATTGNTNPFLLSGGAGTNHNIVVLGGESSVTQTESTTGTSAALTFTLTDRKGTTATTDDTTEFGRDADDDGDIDASDVTVKVGGVSITPTIQSSSGRITAVVVPAANNTAAGTDNISITFEVSKYSQGSPGTTPIASASLQFGADFAAATTRSSRTIDTIDNTAGTITTTSNVTNAAATDSIVITFTYNVTETHKSLMTYATPSLTARGLTRALTGTETTASSGAFTSVIGLFSGADYDKLVVAADTTGVTTFDGIEANATIAADTELLARIGTIAPLLGIDATTQAAAGSDATFIAAIMPTADGEILTVSYSDVGATATSTRSDTANVDLKAPTVAVVSPAHKSWTNTYSQTLTADVTDEVSAGGYASGIVQANADTLMVNRLSNTTDSAASLVPTLKATNSYTISRSITLVAADEGLIRWWVPAKDNAGNVTKYDDTRTKAQVAQAVTNPAILGVGNPAIVTSVPGQAAQLNLDVTAGTISATSTGGKLDTRLTTIPTGSMTATSTSTTVLTDSQAAFTTAGDTLVKVGDTITNLTDGSSCAITALTATTITCAALAAVTGGTGSTENDWDNGDTYKIVNASLGNVIALATGTSQVNLTFAPGTGAGDLDPATVDTSDFTVTGSTISSIEVDKAGTSILITLDAALDTAAKPLIDLTGTVDDTAGNSIVLFTGKTPADGLSPVIGTPTLTGTGASGQAVSNGSLTIAFSSGEAAATTPTVTGTYLNAVSGGNLTATGSVATPTVTSTGTNAWEAIIKTTTATGTSKAGLVNVRISLTDAAGNTATAGIADPDSTTALSSSKPVYSTGALVFEFDNRLNEGINTATSIFTISPDTAPTTDVFSSDTASPYITIDFGNHATSQNTTDIAATGGEDKEYSLTASATTIEPDTHGGVEITSATWVDPDAVSTDVLADVASADLNTFVWAPSTLAVGTHTLTVQAKDDAGNVSTAVGSTTPTSFKMTIKITARADYGVAIKPGSNLISIPAKPSETDINTIIDSDSPIDFVMTYDNGTGLWLVASRDTDADSDTFDTLTGNLSTIDAQHAYWINSDRFLTLKFAIPRASAAEASFPAIINVYEGWNLVPVGDPAQAAVSRATTLAASTGMVDPDVYFSGVTWSAASTFDPARNSYVKTTPDVTTTSGTCLPVPLGGTVPTHPCLENGLGYFVYVTKDGVIIP